MFLCWGNSDLGIAFSIHPGNQASSRVEAKDTALLSSRDGYILELTVWPKMSQASCGVWREDSGLLSKPYSKGRPSSREDWGISWVFSSCGSSVVLLTRYNGELREPLLWRQGSQVSMHVARRSASLLSSHGRGIRPQSDSKNFEIASRVHQVLFRTSRQNVGLLLSRCSGQGPHLALMGKPRGFSRVSVEFSSYGVEFRLPIVLSQGSPIFHSICEGELAIAL